MEFLRLEGTSGNEEISVYRQSQVVYALKRAVKIEVLRTGAFSGRRLTRSV